MSHVTHAHVRPFLHVQIEVLAHQHAGAGVVGVRFGVSEKTNGEGGGGSRSRVGGGGGRGCSALGVSHLSIALQGLHTRRSMHVTRTPLKCS